MGDFIIFSKSVDEHIHHVEDILTTVGEAGVTVNFKKCHFFSNYVDYLGHIIKPVRLKIDQSHTKCLRPQNHRPIGPLYDPFLLYVTYIDASYQI